MPTQIHDRQAHRQSGLHRGLGLPPWTHHSKAAWERCAAAVWHRCAARRGLIPCVAVSGDPNRRHQQTMKGSYMPYCTAHTVPVPVPVAHARTRTCPATVADDSSSDGAAPLDKLPRCGLHGRSSTTSNWPAAGQGPPLPSPSRTVSRRRPTRKKRAHVLLVPPCHAVFRALAGGMRWW